MCVFLQETHSSKEDSTFWSNRWGGGAILFSHGSNRSAGVAICMNKCPGKVMEVKEDTHGHWIAAVLNIEGTSLILLNIYGFNGESRNKILL